MTSTMLKMVKAFQEDMLAKRLAEKNKIDDLFEEESQDDGTEDSSEMANGEAKSPKPKIQTVPNLMYILRLIENNWILAEKHLKEMLNKEQISQLLELSKQYEGTKRMPQNKKYILEAKQDIANKEQYAQKHNRYSFDVKDYDPKDYPEVDEDTGGEYGNSKN
jgi:hypothetical protein